MKDSVKLMPSGQCLSVPADESILDTALHAGINLPHSCRGGSCGSCRARLLQGALDYPFRPPLALTAEEIEEGFALLCQARPIGEVVIEAQPIASPEEIRIKRVPCRVRKLERLGHDVMGVTLQLPAVEPMPFEAGQYLDVLLDGGHRRSFSIASDPSDPYFLQLHIRRVAGGGFSEQVFGELREGALLTIEGPFGAFRLRPAQGRTRLFVAGGTGLAPILSMLSHVIAKGLETPVHLFWGVRGRADLYHHSELERWQDEQSRFRYTPVLSEPGPDDHWEGAAGFVHEAVIAAYPDLSLADVYMAGPPPMIEAGQRLLPANGLTPKQLFFDSFEYSPEALRAMDREQRAP
jgi:CDP-4-dehydro-6-deoxyglucose reductase